MKFLAALLSMVGLATSAGALDITGISAVLGGTNTANSLTNAGNNRMQIASSVSAGSTVPIGPVPDTNGSTIEFTSRYASLLVADRETASSGSTATSMTSAYTITFTVDNPTGQTYRVDIDTLRVGTFTTVADDTGNTTQSLGAVTGTVDSIVEGALALAAQGPVVSTATGTTAINQSSTTLSIFDNALTRTFVVAFTWTQSATSDNHEAGIRMGNTTGGLTTTTADDYAVPGDAATDGHFTTVTTTMIPEPHSGALLASGLAVLAMRGRVGRRSRR